ncbi:MAG: hypothetical protein CL904_07355 [Dehalococcoidia bacterium]|nr:hypothetical protein [Dehalococcoidia bacterium]|tara:strand:+ start:13915 stop:15573 length:1659 start_codon:yes stop_codon:yes gene_type:complete
MAEEPPQGPQGVMLNEEGFRNFLQEITDQYYIDVELSDSFYNFFYPLIETAALEGSTPEEIERLIISNLSGNEQRNALSLVPFLLMANNIWQFGKIAVESGAGNFQDFVQFQLDHYDHFSVVPTMQDSLQQFESLENLIEQTGENDPAPEAVSEPESLPVSLTELPYIPGTGGMLGDWNWLDLWGDVDPRVEDFFDFWVEKFNEQPEDVASAMGVSIEQLQMDFFYDDTHGLYNQSWWRDIEDGVKSHLEFWYQSGGVGAPGMGTSFLDPVYGAGITGLPDYNDYPPYTDPSASNPYNAALEEFKGYAIEAIERQGGGEFIESGIINHFDIARYAYRIMVSGGASYKLGRDREQFTPEQFREKAIQIVEKIFLNEWVDEDGNLKERFRDTTIGIGSISALMNEWKALAKANFMDIDVNDLRKWAKDVKSEKIDKETVDDMILTRAFNQVDWPFTPEEREDYIAQGVSIKDTLQGQYLAVKNLWNAPDLLPDDPWLMANYVTRDEQGNRHFRTANELALAARQNVDRFQHNREFQEFHNDFITGVARMLRGDY